VDERLAVRPRRRRSPRRIGKDAVERETERPLVIKTTRARLHDVESRLRALHPYELPEFVVLSAEAGEAYGRWVSGAVGS
jgi:periplasmic divalent cation tolerance protein